MTASGDIWRDLTSRVIASQDASYTYSVVPSGQGVVSSICLDGVEASSFSVGDLEVQLLIDGGAETQETIESFFGYMGLLDPATLKDHLGLYWETSGSPASFTGFAQMRIPFDSSFEIKIINTDASVGATHQVTMQGVRVEFALV